MTSPSNSPTTRPSGKVAMDSSAADGGPRVVVNGRSQPLSPGMTVAVLVGAWCGSPDGVAVARNREIVPRSQWALTELAPGDRVEIVTAAAGG